MAAEHNFYFRPFCPKNTISCGDSQRQSPYVGLLEDAFLNKTTYGSRAQKATYGLMSTT
jgi:hypothetical protein